MPPRPPRRTAGASPEDVDALLVDKSLLRRIGRSISRARDDPRVRARSAAEPSTRWTPSAASAARPPRRRRRRARRDHPGRWSSRGDRLVRCGGGQHRGGAADSGRRRRSPPTRCGSPPATAWYWVIRNRHPDAFDWLRHAGDLAEQVDSSEGRLVRLMSQVLEMLRDPTPQPTAGTAATLEGRSAATRPIRPVRPVAR